MTESTPDIRERLVRAAADLLAQGGREAASTRAVSAAAGVQPTIIYRQFGDMQGLLDVVARETFAGYMRQEATRERAGDAVEDLRRGWDLHVAFGVANPAAYALIYGDPRAAADAPAARDAAAHLHRLVTRVAEAGRLRVDVPHAVRLLTAAGSGVTLSLISAGPGAYDPRLSHAMREAVLAAITVPRANAAPDGASDSASDSARDGAAGEGRLAALAVALRALLGESAPPGATSRAFGAARDGDRDGLSAGEQYLLGEWLDRLAGARG